MKVKLTNRQAIEMINAFAGMQEKTLPRKLSFAIGKNLEALQAQIYKPYEKEMQRISRAYEVLDSNGNQKVDELRRVIYTDRYAYQDEMNELLEIENDFEMHTIADDLLDQCEKEEKYSTLTVKEELACMRMLES